MRKVLSIIIAGIIFISVNAQTAVFSYSSSSITVNNNFVDELYHESHAGLTPYVLKSSEEMSVQNNSYTIKCYKFNGWEDEMGDFNVIEIYHKGKSILQLKNDAGWDYFQKDNIPLSLRKTYKSFIPILLDNNTGVIMFNGAIDANDPRLLTMIILKDGIAKLIYNKEADITSVFAHIGKTVFNLQLNVIEYHDDHIPYNTAELAELEFKNGMIYYTDK